jgi:hypothetical protein
VNHDRWDFSNGFGKDRADRRMKLTPRDRDIIRELTGEGVPRKQLALAFGVSAQTIYDNS